MSGKIRNERKLEVLECIANLGEVSSAELGNTLGLEIHLARMLLLNYHRQGLLSRRTQGRHKIYEVTEKGLDRIKWLKGSI